MSTTRLRGQEVDILVIVDGTPAGGFVAQSFEVVKTFEQKDEGYLGEKSNRKDFVLTGARFRGTAHIEDPSYFDFIDQVSELARRDVPSRVINLIATFNFPTGETAIITLPDCSFGDMPISVGGRTEYASTTFEGQSSDYATIK